MTPKSLSIAPSLGLGCWRLKTASCWRRARFSSIRPRWRPKPAKHGSEPEPKQVKHGNQVIADRLCRLPCEVVDFTAGQDCDEGQIPLQTHGRTRKLTTEHWR